MPFHKIGASSTFWISKLFWFKISAVKSQGVSYSNNNVGFFLSSDFFIKNWVTLAGMKTMRTPNYTGTKSSLNKRISL